MQTIIKEYKNIPISISFLHDQEYNNLCNLYNINIKNNIIKRRAFTERNNKKNKKLKVVFIEF